MGCGARALQDLDMAPSHYIGVEINSAAKKIAQNLNPASSRFKGIDHSRFSDVMKITTSDISKLGHGAIDKVFFGSPCEDFSFLRLLPNSQGKFPPQGSNPRPGLDGLKRPNSSTMHQNSDLGVGIQSVGTVFRGKCRFLRHEIRLERSL